MGRNQKSLAVMKEVASKIQNTTPSMDDEKIRQLGKYADLSEKKLTTDVISQKKTRILHPNKAIVH